MVSGEAISGRRPTIWLTLWRWHIWGKVSPKVPLKTRAASLANHSENKGFPQIASPREHSTLGPEARSSCRPGRSLWESGISRLDPLGARAPMGVALQEGCVRSSQFVIATHSPIIPAYPDARVYVFGADGIRETPYAETDHYLVTRGFLANSQRVLSGLFDESAGE